MISFSYASIHALYKEETIKHFFPTPSNLLLQNYISDKIIRLEPTKSGLSKQWNKTNITHSTPREFEHHHLMDFSSNISSNKKNKSDMRKGTSRQYHLSKRNLLSLLSQQQHSSLPGSSSSTTLPQSLTSKTDEDITQAKNDRTSKNLHLNGKEKKKNSFKAFQKVTGKKPPSYESVGIMKITIFLQLYDFRDTTKIRKFKVYFIVLKRTKSSDLQREKCNLYAGGIFAIIKKVFEH